MNIFCLLLTILVFLSDNEPTQLFNRANESMNAIFNWFCANRLFLNASKTHYMVINPPHKNLDLSAHSLKIDNVILSKVTSCKFIGIIFCNISMFTQPRICIWVIACIYIYSATCYNGHLCKEDTCSMGTANPSLFNLECCL